ncbi:MAG: hypothetical protein IT349_11005 [Candidatus Eisenbacteria bacterium]|nr:hypothetical protein [Candidatus Eisenbacteria bacterium]
MIRRTTLTRRVRLAAFVLLGGLPFVPGLAWSDASLVFGVQSRQLDIDTGIEGLAPVFNTQTSARVNYTWEMSERWTVVAQGGAARSFLELTDQTLSGPTDARLRVLFRPDDAWAIGCGTIVPLGLYELSAAEVTTAQWTWVPRSGFPITRFGEGWGFEANVAYGRALSRDWTLGLGAAWLRHAEFPLLSGGAGDYQLADETSLSLALDNDLGRSRRLRLDLAYRAYGYDRLEGIDWGNQGSSLDLGSALDLPIGRFRTAASVRVGLKGDNRLTDGTNPDSLFTFTQSPGLNLSADARAATAFGSRWLLSLESRYLLTSESDYFGGTADGNSIAFGPGLGCRLSRALSLSARYMYVTGRGKFDLSLSGHDVLFTVELRQ